MVDYQRAGWIAASTYRLTVAQYLVRDGPARPTTIGEETGVDTSHVSRALGALRDRDCVKLLVPEETQKGRVYDATDGLQELVDAAEDL